MALTKLNNQSLTAVTAAGLPIIGAGNLPSGSIIKTSYFDEIATIPGNASSYESGNTITFSKALGASDSMLIYTWQGWAYVNPNSGSYIITRLNFNSSYTTERHGVEANEHTNFTCAWTFNNLATGNHTFTMQAKWDGSPNNNGQLRTDTEQGIIIMEVKK